MPLFTSRYTDAQREAAALAFGPGGCTAARVLELAAAGELPGADGKPLPPFEITNESSVRDWHRKLGRRKAAKARTPGLEVAPPRDAIEGLRGRLVRSADEILQEEEKKDAADRDLERMRQIIRCVREAAAIPSPVEPLPPPPGAKRDGERFGGETRGGLAGAMLQDHRESNGGWRAAAAEPAPAEPAQAEPDPPADPLQDVLREDMKRRGLDVDDEDADLVEREREIYARLERLGYHPPSTSAQFAAEIFGNVHAKQRQDEKQAADLAVELREVREGLERRREARRSASNGGEE